MKKYLKIIFSAILLSVIGLSSAQTTTENYIHSKVYMSADGSKTAETIQYFDGLGRPKQTISVKATPNGKDLVVPVTYDDLGRVTKDYLPVPMPTTNLGIQSVSESTVNSYYGVSNAFTEKKMERSPLSRLTEVAHPGSEWAMSTGHTQRLTYDINTIGDQVKKYLVTTTWSNGTATPSLPTVTLYPEKVLIKNTLIDEDGNTTIEFKNSLGQIILLRNMSGSEKLDTYYVYNNYGHLVYVISPKGNHEITQNNNVVTQTILNNLCYQYLYDNRGRQVEKQLPGKGREYFVYDLQNRLVASQDAVQNLAGKWLFTRYDKFGRTVYTGQFTGGNRQAEQANANNKGMNNESRNISAFTVGSQSIYYTNTAYPSTDFIALSVNYYDTYPDTISGKSIVRPVNILGQTTLGAVATSFDINGVKSKRLTKGLSTASLIKNLEDNAWTSSLVWYDTQARPIGSNSINHLGGFTKTEKQLSFSGAVLFANTYHKKQNTDSEVQVKERFVYDNQYRLKEQYHQVNTQNEVLLAQYVYNDLGQVLQKKVGNNIQQVDYQYNIRGWLTSINDPSNLGGDLFGYKIKYTSVDGLETPDASDTNLKIKPRYNGNIAEVDWKTAITENDPMKRYGYVYDDTNRLLAGFYQKSTNPSIREYYEKATYDLNGNILTMKRTAQQVGSTALLIDNMSYHYENTGASNRLKKISDTVTIAKGYPYKETPTNIGYDDNGNITVFADKGISSIQYNLLNLPKQITQNAKVTSYTYRADGVKVKKLFDDKETHYLDGFLHRFTQAWEDESGNLQTDEVRLRIIPTSEGYYDALRKRYFYNYTDHLGNVRLTYSEDVNGDGIVTGDVVVNNCHTTPDGSTMCNNYIITGEIDGVTNYYPFGLMHNSEYHTFDNAYQYKYNGKELQETGMYDYGARMYMPDIGRWGVSDPLAEQMRRHSPYNYAFNNPIRYIDPDGRSPKVYNAGQTYEGQEAVDLFYALKDRSVGIMFEEKGPTYKTYSLADDTGSNGGGNHNPINMENFNQILSWLQSYSRAGLNHAMHMIKTESPKDIIILNASKEVGGLGHDGTIIGNDKDGYYYIASNGLVDPYPKSELISGGKNEADVKYFKTRQEALNYAQSKYDYDRTLTIKTSRTQDFGAVAGALKQVRMDYFPLHNNCNHVVAGALNGAGLGGYAGYSTIPNINFNEIRNNFLKK